MDRYTHKQILLSASKNETTRRQAAELAAAGWDVRLAHTPDELLAAASLQPVDLLLLQLPPVDGSAAVDAACQFLQLQPAPLILLASGLDAASAARLRSQPGGRFLPGCSFLPADAGGPLLLTAVQMALQAGEAWRGAQAEAAAHRLAEAELQESKSRLEMLFEILPVGVSVLDRQRRVALVNPALEHMLGISHEGLLRGDYRSRRYLHPDGSPMLPGEFASGRVLAGEPAALQVETGVVKQDGHVVWTEVSAAACPLGDWSMVIVTQDITARKIASQTFQTQLEELRLVIENSQDMIFVTDPQYRLVLANQAFQTALVSAGGQPMTPGDPVLVPVYPPEFLETWKGYYDRALAGENLQVQTRLNWLDGEHILENTLNPLRDAAGCINGVLVMSHDVTDHVRLQEALKHSRDELEQRVQQRTAELTAANQALRDSQERLELALSAANMGMFRIEAGQQFPLIDPRACRLLGLDPQAYRGTPTEVAGAIHPEDLPRIMVEMRSQLGQKTPQEMRFRAVWPDGSLHHLISRGQLYFDEQGQTRGAYGILWDITHRIQAEQALRDSEATLNSFFNSTQALMGIFRLLPEAGDIEYLRLNQAAARYMGIPLESLPGIRDSQVGASEENRSQWMGQCRLCQASGLPVQFEFEVERPNHAWLLVDINAIEPGIFTFTASDITPLKDLQCELQQLNTALERRVAQRTAELSRANRDLERALRLRDEFLNNMSHELRTPLTGILGLSEALQAQVYGEFNPRQARALENIHISGTRLLGLVDNLLEMTQLAAGKIVLQPETVDVDSLVQDCMVQIRPEAMARRLELNTRQDMRLEFLLADEKRLKQILVSLLENAVKFTPEGGKVGLEVEADPDAGQIRWVVWDTGIGIPPNQHEHILEPFVQLDGGLSRQHGGTGLGLAMVNELVKLHVGSLDIQSSAGEGSRFTVILPWLQRKV